MTAKKTTDHMTREQRLEMINLDLADRDLRPLHKLGDHTQGEIELVEILEFHEQAARFFTDVRFRCLFPDGQEGEYTIRFNANSRVSDGAIMVVLVNGRFAIAKQWRPPLGRWTYELPRGFGEKLDQAQLHGRLGTVRIGDLPLGTLVREFGEEVMADAQVTSVTHLGNIAENSSTHSATPACYLISIQVDEHLVNGKLRGSDGEVAEVRLWDAAKIRQELGRKLCDAHTLGVLCLALNYIESLPRP